MTCRSLINEHRKCCLWYKRNKKSQEMLLLGNTNLLRVNVPPLYVSTSLIIFL